MINRYSFQGSTSDRDCENELVLNLGLDAFDFIRILRQNRKMILFCTLLARAESKSEKEAIELSMQQDPELSKILRQLKETDQQNIVEEERTKRAKTRQARLEAEANIEMAEAWFQQRHMLDLEDLSFNQGSHFMANKKCALPDGSYRKQNKGYEEVHVPALKSKEFAKDEKLITIEELPEYARPAFDGYRTLNRIQSRLAGAALETDENLLLCAPTVSYQ